MDFDVDLYLDQSARAAASLATEDWHQQIRKAADSISRALRGDGTVFFAGNGGSAADSQHLAAELMGRMRYEREPLRALALTTDTSALTAIGNDYGFENVFSRQLQGLSRKGDVFVGISTSGQSPNIIRAFLTARDAHLTTIALAGPAGILGAQPDIVLRAPGAETGIVQQSHITIGQALCALVEVQVSG